MFGFEEKSRVPKVMIDFRYITFSNTHYAYFRKEKTYLKREIFTVFIKKITQSSDKF